MKKKDLIQGFFSNWNKKRNEQIQEEVCNRLLNNLKEPLDKANNRNIIKKYSNGSQN